MASDETQHATDVPGCSQCGTPAVVRYGGHALCVDHHLRMEQAKYLATSMNAAQLNVTREEISRATGGLVPPVRIEIPRPPFTGDQLTLNNINVSHSTVGAINTGTVRNLDSRITLFEAGGRSDLAAAALDFAQAVVDSREIDDSLRNELAEQLDLLLSQVDADASERLTGTIRSVLAGVRGALVDAAALLAAWDRLEPILQDALLT